MTDIRRSILGPDDIDETAEVLAEVFTGREPLARALSITPAEFAPLARSVCKAAAATGLSVIARDRAGRVIGFRIAEPWPAEEAEALASPPAFAPIFSLLGRLEEAFDRIHAADLRAVHFQMMGCVEAYARRGVATAMVGDALQIAARRGFPRVFAEATHQGSARVFERLGFETLAEVPYDTFAFEGRRVFAGVPASGCRLVVKDLA